MKYQADNFYYGYDRSEHDEWNTYAAENLDEESYGFIIWNEDEEDME